MFGGHFGHRAPPRPAGGAPRYGRRCCTTRGAPPAGCSCRWCPAPGPPNTVHFYPADCCRIPCSRVDLDFLPADSSHYLRMHLLPSHYLRSDDPDLEAAAAAASLNPNLETAAAAAAANMHRVTGTFADPSHESAFAAQLFRMAYPTHVLLMALVLAVYTWMGLIQPDMRAHWAVLVLCVAIPGLVCRVLLQNHPNPVRSQWMGSWAWMVLTTICFAVHTLGFIMAPAAKCAAFLQAKYLVPFVLLLTVLISGTHGLSSACKFTLMTIFLTNFIVGLVACHDPELDPWFICTMGAIVLGSATAHTAELYLRRIYAEKVQEQQSRTEEAGEKRQLEERNEQLQAEKERLLYDVQRRGRPLDDDDDRSAIRRGLQAGPSQSFPSSSDTDLTEPAGALSDSPPTLPPGPPSSASSGSVASLGQKVVPARLVVPATWAGSNLSGAPNYSGVEPTAAAPTAAPTVEPSPLLRHASFSAPPKRPDQSTWLRGFAASAAALARARWTRSPEEGKGHAPSATARASSGEQEQLAAEALADLATAEGATMAQPFVSTTWRARSSRNLTGFSEGVRSSEGGSNAELQKEAKQLRQIGGSTSPKASLKREGHTEEDRRTTVTIASSSMTSEMKVPHQHRAVSGGVSTCSTVEDKFYMHVICNYTPRAPGELPMKHWVSCAQMLRELQPHAPEEDYVNQLITNHFKNHPTFAGHPFCAWCKKLKDYDAPARGTSKKNVMKFSLEYTPASVRVSK